MIYIWKKINNHVLSLVANCFTQGLQNQYMNRYQYIIGLVRYGIHPVSRQGTFL